MPGRKSRRIPHTPPGVIGDALEEGVSIRRPDGASEGRMDRVDVRGAAGRARCGAGARRMRGRPECAGSGRHAGDRRSPSSTATTTSPSCWPAKAPSVNLADRTGATPLYSAVDMHTLVTSFGRPELPRAVTDGSVGAARMLLAHGANPERAAQDEGAEAHIPGRATRGWPKARRRSCARPRPAMS